MARTSPSLTLTTLASIGAGVATTLYNAIAAGILGVWSIGALQTFGAGATERNYWVLTSGSFEILFCLSNSASVANTAMVWASKITSPGGFQNLQISASPDGGFAASFAAGNDPASQPFWDHITVTLGLREPTNTFFFLNFYSGYTNVKVRTVVDLATKMIMILVGDRTGNTTYDAIIIADDLVQPVHPIATRPNPEGLIWIRAGGGTPPLPAVTFSLWDSDDSLVTSVDTGIEVQTLQNVTAAAMNLTNKVQTVPLQLFDSTKMYGYANVKYTIGIPLLFPGTYKAEVGTDPDYGWWNAHEYLLVPGEYGAGALS